MSALKFFLTFHLQPPNLHNKGWEWCVMDREGLHQDLLQLLIRESPRFSTSLFGAHGDCIRQSVHGLFDLEVRSEDRPSCFIEIKTDQGWGGSQRARQLEHIKAKPGTTAVLILLSQTGCSITREEVKNFSGGVMRKISYRELCGALEDAAPSIPSDDLRNVMLDYKAALAEHEEIMTKRYNGSPNE